MTKKFIFGRNLIGTLTVLLHNNVKFKQRVYDDVPAGSAKNWLFGKPQNPKTPSIEYNLNSNMSLITTNYMAFVGYMAPEIYESVMSSSICCEWWINKYLLISDDSNRRFTTSRAPPTS